MLFIQNLNKNLFFFNIVMITRGVDGEKIFLLKNIWSYKKFVNFAAS